MKGLNVALLLHLSLHSLATIARAETPTFNLRNIDDYIGDLTNDQGTEPGDIKVIDSDNGLEVIVGADLTQEILGVAKEHCQDPTSEECATKMHEALGIGPSSNGLQKRVVPLAPAGVVAGIAAIFQWAMNRIDKAFSPENLKVIHINMSKEEKEQAASWEQTDSIQVKPQEGDPVTISFDNTQPQLSNVPTLTLDDNGDIIIDFKGTEAAIQNAWSGVMCKREEGITLQCIIDRIRVFLRLIQLGGEANQLMWLAISVSLKPKHELLIEAIKDAEDYAENLWFDKSIAKEAKRKIGTVVAWATFADTMAAIPIHNGLMKWPKSWIETQEMIRYECPEGDKRTFCSNCGGDADPGDGITFDITGISRVIMGKCIGLGDGEKKGLEGCECFKDPGIQAHELSVQDMENFYNLVMNGKPDPSGGKRKQCYKEDKERMKDHTNWKFVQQTVLDETIKKRCDQFQQTSGPGEKEIQDTATEEDWDYAKLKIYEPEAGMFTQEMCHSMFSEISVGCDSSPLEENNPNQFNWKWGGEIELENGVKASIEPVWSRVWTDANQLEPDGNFHCYSLKKFSDNNNKGNNEAEIDDNAKMTLQQCIHWPYNNYETSSDFNCGGLLNLGFHRCCGYNDGDTCAKNTWKCLSYYIEQGESARGEHKPLSTDCWMDLMFKE